MTFGASFGLASCQQWRDMARINIVNHDWGVAPVGDAQATSTVKVRPARPAMMGR